MITQKQIEEIITIFDKIGVWNNGKFSEEVTKYCEANNLDVKQINAKLEIAFRDYLATNITSQAAIRLRLSNLLPKNVAL
jgi:hypothetical protein